ncbi:hypothetical protein BH11PSE9_BH11PSE9_18470 [soil metagenome]
MSVRSQNLVAPRAAHANRPFDLLRRDSRLPAVGADLEAALRQEWIGRCTRRLVELRPLTAANVVAELVQDMWRDVACMDPEIAAEIEHESWQSEH